MSIYRELSTDQDIETINHIQFSVLSPDEILARSVVEVTKTDTYAGSEPVVGGLFDPRMGVLEFNRVCRTCDQKNTFCQGHFGHINLARPMFNFMFFDTIKKLLRCVCYRCSKVLATPDANKKVEALMSKKTSPAKRWAAMYDLCSKVKKCGEHNGEHGCGARQPSKYTKEGILRIMAGWTEPEARTQEITTEDTIRIFQRITDADLELLGFNPKWARPEWMILTAFPVPPPAVRPSVMNEAGQRCEDDLTHILCDIIKANNQLKLKLEKGNSQSEQVQNYSQLLQYHVAVFMDNNLPNLPAAHQRNGRKMKSISDRLKKKEGRIRGNLNGKRVDQSARSVITPDPYMSLDELGVPYKIAMNLTFPETVNQYNREEMQSLVANGPDTYPGAKYIRKARDGRTITLRYHVNRDQIILEDGDVVDRHLRDGDVVLFNRQPSLHKMSMMGHRVRVMPYQTFRMNPCVCAPYNADFDGDKRVHLSCPQQVAAC